MKKMVALIALVSSSTYANTWNDKNDPRNLSDNYNYHLSSLPLKASLPLNKMPWSSSYWPRNKGSVNYRWNTENPTGFKINRPSAYQVRMMSKEDLARLSPAEKFDLVQGRYDYPFSVQVEKGSKKSAKDFEGICDGWTAAALQFSEPAPVEMKNPDGIVIPFGSSDIKALMSYDISLNAKPGALDPHFVGEYCGVPMGRKLGLPGCKDINPGAFHVVLTNQIGLMKEAFAADMDPGSETWNHPVYAYEIEIQGETRTKDSAQAYVVKAKIMYSDDDPEGENASKVFSWNPTVGTADFMYKTMEVEYILELDYSGRIIGGEWIGSSKNNHPDLFWKPMAKIEFTPEFQLLNTLYKPSF